ncbi:MAG TPA: TetR/AcrR family transcriptional regulator [Acidimicrobiales bacterium]|nr:TetR/AcrR family transcriptional regulator [Acidimicrobiales bacterium]
MTTRTPAIPECHGEEDTATRLSDRPAPTRLPAHRRRRQLLDVAVEVFADRGYHGTSMEGVAEAAGVTKPVLYQHFSSKRGLYLELLDDVGSRLVDAVTTSLAAASGPRHQVEAGFAAYFRFVARERHAFRLLFGSGARGEEEFADAVRQVEDRMADAIAVLIDADVGAEHRQIVGYGIVGLAEVTSRHWVSVHDVDKGGEASLEEAARLAGYVTELAWGGLRAVHRGVTET